MRAGAFGVGLFAALAAAGQPAVARRFAAEGEDGPPPCYLPETMQEDGAMARVPTPDALESAYECLEGRLLDGYARSKHVLAKLVGTWERVSRVPFRYEGIGDRYLVIYGNDRAVGKEDTLWLDRDLPVGATVAAAGFTVDDDGRLSPAPLFLYEKMPQGYRIGRGNWRQTLIGPDGKIVAVTKGPGADRLTVCAECGAGASDRMYLALLNDGTVPDGAPEAGPPITGGGFNADGGGEILDPSALLAPLSRDEPAASRALHPNATPGETILDPVPEQMSEPAPSEEGATMTDLSLSDSAGLAKDDLAKDDLDQDAMAEENPSLAAPSEIEGETPSGLALELRDANDPLLPVPSVAVTDPPPLESADGT